MHGNSQNVNHAGSNLIRVSLIFGYIECLCIGDLKIWIFVWTLDSCHSSR